ncbi:MAG TPA: hypothetical protein DDX39_07555 [Bacteroidales bacterium]|nr:MAG: hypothetical protein A2265_10400 [Bacteroidetes bacterium RIFOXYA12_FULL_33_9]HBF88480.1 hypothetical protein [Bacteroidales bacterium]
MLFIALVSVLTISLVTNTSCKKPKPPKAIITVVDTAEYTIEGAMVVIYVDKNGAMIDPNAGIVSDTDYTGSNGTVEFEFSNEAIFDVYVEKTYGDTVTLTGEGIIVLKNDELAEEEVEIK